MNVHIASPLVFSLRQRFARARALAALPLVWASMSCSDGTVAPTRGSLEVIIAGLPTGQPAGVTVTGPGNTSQALTATATLNDVAAGSYDVRADNVTAGDVVYVPTPATQRIAVTGGKAATATVTYTSSTFTLSAQQIVEGLQSPVYLTAPKNDPRLFIVEQPGRIRIVKDGALLATPFLDITARVVSGGERGLLSLAFDPAYARAAGVRTGELLLSQPDSGEQALDIVESLASSREIALVVIDSVAALVPQAEIDGSMGDNHLGLQARLMSRALRKLAVVAAKTNTTLIFVNQLRHKIGVTFGSPETTPGGNALKFYASQRLDVRRIGKVSADERVIGNRTRVKVVKNKCAQPFAEAEFDIRWGTGIDITSDLLDTATAAGVLLRNGSHFVYRGKSVGQGRERARAALLESAELRGAVLEETLGLVWSGATLAACPPSPDDTDGLLGDAPLAREAIAAA